MRRIFLVAAVACFCATAASAQTKLSGTAQCAKPDQMNAVAVGDRADHSLFVAQIKCTYTKPIEIGGDKSKDGVSTETADSTGNTAKARGFHVVTMESGDKVVFRYEGMATSKDGNAVDAKGNWTLHGGTGKLKGIKGKGTYDCKASGDGGLSCEVEGEYQSAK